MIIKMTSLKTSILAALFTSLLGHMEWGGGNAAFVYESEYLVFFQKNSDVNTFTHPIVLLPLIGQITLLVSLLRRQPNRRVVLAGLAGIGLLFLLIALAGLLSLNGKMLLSTVPYFLSVVWCWRSFKK
jgi:uncharacterized membrane protein